MKVIVHIGAEKTGTTSIQEFLFKNRKEFIKHGYYFLQSAGLRKNRALPAYCMRLDRYDDFFVAQSINTIDKKKAFQNNFLKNFKNEMNELPKDIHTVLISSEHFHSRVVYDDEIEKLKLLLKNYFSDIKIVSYIRDQVDTVTSLYSTAIKVGEAPDFKSFVESCNPSNDYFNYDVFLKKWEGGFGIENMVVSIFDKDELYNRDLIDDFMLKIDAKLIGQMDKGISIENESLTYVGQMLGKAINLSFPEYNKVSGNNPLRQKLINYTYKSFKGKGETVSEEKRAEILHGFNESNNYVLMRYFPEKSELFKGKATKLLDKAIPSDFYLQLKDIFDIVNNHNDILLGKYADILRDSALIIENEDVGKAYELMNLAHQVRPSGPFIKKKLEEYRQKLRKH